jgi:hypothetical protein
MDDIDGRQQSVVIGERSSGVQSLSHMFGSLRIAIVNPHNLDVGHRPQSP